MRIIEYTVLAAFTVGLTLTVLVPLNSALHKITDRVSVITKG
jgi:hypothetical protein